MLFQKWAKEKDNAVAAPHLMNFLIKLCRGFVISMAIKMRLLSLIFPAVGEMVSSEYYHYYLYSVFTQTPQAKEQNDHKTTPRPAL